MITAGHCHCRDCQLATGSGKATIIFLPDAGLTLAGELKSYTVIGTDGSHVTRGFCPECGSPIVSYTAEQPNIKFIKAGSLDEPDWVQPETNFWQRSAQPWDPVNEALPGFDANP